MDISEIKLKLESAPGWLLVDKRIVKRFEFKDFKKALKFVNLVGEVAEALNHHPDIRIEYNNVILELTSHQAGGLTEKDFELAQKINQLKQT